MLGDKVSVKINNDSVTLKNISDSEIKNGFISIKTIFYLPIVNEKFNLNVSEEISFNFYNFKWKDRWGDGTLFVKVYENHKVIFSKDFFDKSKCFVLISNKPFEKLTEQLIVGLDRYSNVDILHYNINYKSDLKYDNLINIEFTIPGDTQDPQYMQFTKPPVFIDVLNRGYKGAVFLDADIQIKSNINSLFDYLHQIEDGPIMHKSQWDYIVANGNYVPQPKLHRFMNLSEEQPAPHGVTNVVIFNDTHLEMFKKWEEICFSDEIQQIRKEEFLHDELIFNCLMWRDRIIPKLFFFALNILTEKDVDFFYNFENKDYIDGVNLNEHGLGQYLQSYLPYDKTSIIGFHCVKDIEMAGKINDIILINEKIPKQVMIPKTIYSDLVKNKNIKQVRKVTIINTFVKGAFTEILNGGNELYKIDFINKSNGDIEHTTTIPTNHWSKTNKEYFIDWKVVVTNLDTNKIVYEHDYNAEGKRVYIAFESSALGDTLAWIPYVDEFRKKHKCKVVCSTFMNDLFENEYPEIEFVKPGVNVTDLYAMYSLGLFYNEDNSVQLHKNPTDPKLHPLQKMATDILGLDYVEIKPKIKHTPIQKEKQVSIAIHGTAQTKYWNNPNGWQEVVDWVKSKGYKVKLVSKEGDDYMGNKHPIGIEQLPAGPIEGVMNEMLKSEVFIGIGSGLSWLAWSLGVKNVLISGFSYDWAEMKDCIRIGSPKGKCAGCFNRIRLDAGDWNWCPDHKGTERQFECTKSITSEMVIKELEKIL
jgi:autotransporter strand-loop-strand O-heptosyltransferase